MRLLLVHNGMHAEIVIDRTTQVGKPDPAGDRATWILEAALTTIQDCEDSVAAVDPRRQAAGLSQLARPDEGRVVPPVLQSEGGTRNPHAAIPIARCVSPEVKALSACRGGRCC